LDQVYSPRFVEHASLKLRFQQNVRLGSGSTFSSTAHLSVQLQPAQQQPVSRASSASAAVGQQPAGG